MDDALTKPFLLFAGNNYYPSGGWDDYVDSYSTLEEAKAVGEDRLKSRADWSHIVDIRVGGVVVYSNGRDVRPSLVWANEGE